MGVQNILHAFDMANPRPPCAGRHRTDLPGRLLHRPVLRRHRGLLRVPALGTRRAERAGAGRRVGVPVRRDRRGGRQPVRRGPGRPAGQLPPPAVRPGPAARRDRPALEPAAGHPRDERRERGLRAGPAGSAAQARRLLGLRPGRAGLLARWRGDRRADRLRGARHQRVRPGRNVPGGDPGADRQGPAGRQDAPRRAGRRGHRAGRHPVPARRAAGAAGRGRGAAAGPGAGGRGQHQPRRGAGGGPGQDGTVTGNALVVAGIVTLAAGTYAFRLSGQLLRARITFPPRVTRLLEAAAVILLAALVATTALTEGHGFAGFARPAGVLVAGVLAWRKAPFLVVVLAAAAVTALLRLLGVS